MKHDNDTIKKYYEGIELIPKAQYAKLKFIITWKHVKTT